MQFWSRTQRRCRHLAENILAQGFRAAEGKAYRSRALPGTRDWSRLTEVDAGEVSTNRGEGTHQGRLVEQLRRDIDTPAEEAEAPEAADDRHHSEDVRGPLPFLRVK